MEGTPTPGQGMLAVHLEIVFPVLTSGGRGAGLPYVGATVWFLEFEPWPCYTFVSIPAHLPLNLGGRSSELEVILSPSVPWGPVEVLGSAQNGCSGQVHLDRKRLEHHSYLLALSLCGDVTMNC